MKKLIYILLLAVVAVGFVSCEEDRDSNPIWNEDAAKTFVLNMPAVAVNNVLDLEGSDNVVFTTSQPDYGFPVSTVYTTWVSLDGAEYVALPTTSTSAVISIPAKEINEALLGLLGDGDVSEPMPVKVKLTAALFADPEMGKAESNVIELPKVKVYVPKVEVTLPTKMHIVGGFAASEGWSKFVALAPAYSQEGMFYGVVYLAEGDEFKINPDAGWKGNDMGTGQITLDGDIAATCENGDKGNNLKMGSASGWYNVIVKAKIANGAVQYTMSMIEAKVYIIGAAFGGVWEKSDDALFTAPATANGEWVSPAFTGSGELRMFIDCGIDWWKTEFTLDGDNNIFYRTMDIPSNWAENVGAAYSKQVNPDGHVYLNFTAGTGRIE
ncbi:MAG: SusF/SusE family outer membrane protein [Muribaculaceae bacterium]|nr:SusF/SusE family outer membrane protein [Muribaculaceae bacterium]